MSKSGDAIQVSMFDSLPDLAPQKSPPKASGIKASGAKDSGAKDSGVKDSGPHAGEDEDVVRLVKARSKSSPATALASDEAFTLENFLPYRLLEVAQGISRRISRELNDAWGHEHGRMAGASQSGARMGLCPCARSNPAPCLIRLLFPELPSVSQIASSSSAMSTNRTSVWSCSGQRKEGGDVASEIGHYVMGMEADFLKGMNVQDRIRLSQLLNHCAERSPFFGLLCVVSGEMMMARSLLGAFV